jgi:hypothetical protein
LSINSFKISKSISLSAISTPSSPSNGEIYYDGGTNLFKFYQNGSWVSLSAAIVYTTGKALQTNASTGLIEVSSVTNTQLGYLSGSTGTTGTNALVFGTSPTLVTPVISSIVNTGTLTLPTSTDTLVGRATTDALSQKSLAFSTATDSTTTGTQATLQAFTAGKVSVTNASLVSIAGIPAGIDGQMLFLENNTGNSLNILNNDSGATASNRFYTGTGNALAMANQASLVFCYNSTNSKWQTVAGSGGSSPGVSDIVTLGSGVSSGTVTLATPVSGTNYVVVAQIENLVDTNPIFQNLVITNKTTTGFSWKTNSPTDTTNYKISYKILNNSTGSGIQVGEASVNSGVNSISITIPIPFSTTTYVAVVNMVNYLDTNPAYQPCLITAKTNSSFTVSFPDVTDTANYKIAYNLG